jgi:hypothetical protein
MTPIGLLQLLLIPTRIWTDVSMDFIEGLPPSRGYIVIMVVVNRLTICPFYCIKTFFYYRTNCG